MPRDAYADKLMLQFVQEPDFSHNLCMQAHAAAFFDLKNVISLQPWQAT